MLHSGRICPYSRTLDKAGNVCERKHSSLSQTFVNYDRKTFRNIGARFGNNSPFGQLFEDLGNFGGKGRPKNGNILGNILGNIRFNIYILAFFASATVWATLSKMLGTYFLYFPVTLNITDQK